MVHGPKRFRGPRDWARCDIGKSCRLRRADLATWLGRDHGDLPTDGRNPLDLRLELNTAYVDLFDLDRTHMPLNRHGTCSKQDPHAAVALDRGHESRDR